jgi:hypothetical protein
VFGLELLEVSYWVVFVYTVDNGRFLGARWFVM